MKLIINFFKMLNNLRILIIDSICMMSNISFDCNPLATPKKFFPHISILTGFDVSDRN